MSHTHKKKSTHRRPKRKLAKWETITEVQPGPLDGTITLPEPRSTGVVSVRWRSNAIAPPPNWGNKGK